MTKENDLETKPAVSEPVICMADLDEETIQLLVDDKIATGG